MIVGTQSYVWFQIYQALGKKHSDHWDEVLAGVAEAGCQAFEGTVDDVASPHLCERMASLLAKHGLVS